MNRTTSSLKQRLRAAQLKKPGWNADPRPIKNHLTGTFMQRPMSPNIQSAPNFDIVDIYNNEVREKKLMKLKSSSSSNRPKTTSNEKHRFANSQEEYDN